MNGKKLEAKEYYISYFDILGYKAFFEDKENNISELLASNIAMAMDTRKRFSYLLPITNKIHYKMFSDNFIIMLEDGVLPADKALSVMCDLTARLQLKFLVDYGIPIRGAITKGQAYIDNTIVFGKGLIDAVGLEASEAIYPRIILDDACSEMIRKGLNIKSVGLDKDQKYYLDFLSLLMTKDDSDPGVSVKMNREKIGERICKLVSRYGHYDKRITKIEKINQNEKTILKYLWLLIKYNEFADKYHLVPRIDYSFVANESLFRFEIVDVRLEQ